MSSNKSSGGAIDQTSGVHRIVVLGGGIAGAEAALTMAAGLPDARVTLVGRAESIHLLPELIYVPFGVEAQLFDVPLASLAEFGVETILADVERVDTDAHLIMSDRGPISYDTLIAAPGAEAMEHSHALRTLDDAMALRKQLIDLRRRALRGERTSIIVRSLSDDSWSAPASELAALLGWWRRAFDADRSVSVALVCPDIEAFEWFGPAGALAVSRSLDSLGVEVLTQVPQGRMSEMGGDVVVEFGPLRARRVLGLPRLNERGWYEPLEGLAVAPDVYVVGDALDMPYRAGFATAWHARRVLAALGGDLHQFGDQIDGIPVGAVEYQMDLGDAMLRARLSDARSLSHPFLGHDADVDLIADAVPRKLAGLLLNELVLNHQREPMQAAQQMRDQLLIPRR